MILYFRRLGAQRRRLSGRGGELLAADRELACTEEYAKGAGIYLTEHFVITAAYAFDVIPYTRISSCLLYTSCIQALTIFSVLTARQRVRHRILSRPWESGKECFRLWWILSFTGIRDPILPLSARRQNSWNSCWRCWGSIMECCLLYTSRCV